MYYIMGHISRFIRPGMISVVVNQTGNDNNKIWIISVKDNAGNIVTVILNSDDKITFNIELNDIRKGKLFLNIEPHSVYTIIYQIIL